MTLLADRGRDLVFEATLLLAREWDGPPVLGYTNALDRLRFALDPGVVPGEARWYFGQV